MVVTTQSKDSARSTYGTLYEQVRQLYGRTAYSHKTHEKQADIELGLFKALTNSQIFLSALTTGSLILAVFGDSKWETILGALFATMQFGLTVYLKEINLQEKAGSHSSTARSLWRIREDLMTLIVDMHDNRISLEDAISARTSIFEGLDKTYANALRTSPRAYGMAQKSLKQSGDLHFDEGELDRLIG